MSATYGPEAYCRWSLGTPFPCVQSDPSRGWQILFGLIMGWLAAHETRRWFHR